jgi:cbb3-type cytochrome oxidase subunit 3
MTMSAEAIIGLIALFIACIPGIRFIRRRHNRVRQDRADGAAFPLSGTHHLSLVSNAPTLIAPYLRERTGLRFLNVP